MTEQLNANFRADHFRAASLIVSKEETRYYLTGVLVEPNPAGGIFLVATDGHKLVVIHDPNGSANRPAILSCDFKSSALKTKRPELGRRVILTGNTADIRNAAPDDDDTEATITVDRMLFEEVDGPFPSWRRVVPLDINTTESGVFSFNGNYLKTIVDSVKLLTSERMTQLEIFQKAPNDPAVIRCLDAPDALYVIMPIRARCDSSTPDWLRLPAAGAGAANQAAA